MDVQLAGIGSYLPSRVVPNESFATLLGLDAEWIRKRTGRARRHLARPKMDTRQMAEVAAREALARSSFPERDLGLVIVASSFHHPFPRSSTAEMLKHSLSLTHARAVDLCTPLTGFMDALDLARRALAQDSIPAVLVVGAEGFSDATRLKDRRICYLLSDGAGALLLTRGSGFARVGEVRYHTREPAEHSAREANGEWESFISFGSRVSLAPEALLELFTEASDDSAPGRSRGTLHLITQQADAAALTGRLPSGVRLFNPFADTGYFLAASLPLALHQLIHSDEFKLGDRCQLFATDGLSTSSSCLVDLDRIPDWLTRARAVEGEPAGQSRRGDEAAATITELSREELAHGILQEARRTQPDPGNLVCIGLRLELLGGARSELQSRAERETVAILRRHCRATDELFKLQHAFSFALLLQHLHREDAQRLCVRLKAVLENLDPAGEIEFRVDVRAFTLGGEHAPESFASQVVDFLSP